MNGVTYAQTLETLLRINLMIIYGHEVLLGRLLGTGLSKFTASGRLLKLLFAQRR